MTSETKHPGTVDGAGVVSDKLSGAARSALTAVRTDGTTLAAKMDEAADAAAGDGLRKLSRAVNVFVLLAIFLAERGGDDAAAIAKDVKNVLSGMKVRIRNAFVAKLGLAADTKRGDVPGLNHAESDLSRAGKVALSAAVPEEMRHEILSAVSKNDTAEAVRIFNDAYKLTRKASNRPPSLDDAEAVADWIASQDDAADWLRLFAFQYARHDADTFLTVAADVRAAVDADSLTPLQDGAAIDAAAEADDAPATDAPATDDAPTLTESGADAVALAAAGRIVKRGGGWYEADGIRVKGRAAAVALCAEHDAAGSIPADAVLTDDAPAAVA